MLSEIYKQVRNSILFAERIVLVRFVLVGTLNTVATYLLYLILLFLGLNYRTSYFFAFLLAVVITTWMNYRYTFNGSFKISNALIYIAYYCLYFGCCIIIVDTLIMHVNISEIVAPILTMIIVLYPNYFLSKKLILRKK